MRSLQNGECRIKITLRDGWFSPDCAMSNGIRLFDALMKKKKYASLSL